MKADIAVVGLAVMGRNLALNMADHGFQVAVYNRTTAKTTAFMNEEGQAAGIASAHTLDELVGMLAVPRKVMLMVQAGSGTDAVIEALIPLLAEGDIIIDGGNAHYEDTIRRTRQIEEHGFLFIGTGVSGGEEGARYGPSIMPGGSKKAWPAVREILQSISAIEIDPVGLNQSRNQVGCGPPAQARPRFPRTVRSERLKASHARAAPTRTPGPMVRPSLPRRRQR